MLYLPLRAQNSFLGKCAIFRWLFMTDIYLKAKDLTAWISIIAVKKKKIGFHMNAKKTKVLENSTQTKSQGVCLNNLHRVQKNTHAPLRRSHSLLWGLNRALSCTLRGPFSAGFRKTSNIIMLYEQHFSIKLKCGHHLIFTWLNILMKNCIHFLPIMCLCLAWTSLLPLVF